MSVQPAVGGGITVHELEELSNMPSWSTSRTLKVLDIAFRNQLTENSIKANQPEHISLTLRDHQLALLAAMESREKDSIAGIQFGNTTTYARYGILGDEVGSGKSLVVLAYIAMMKNKSIHQKSYNLFPDGRSDFFTVYTKDITLSTNSNLIVVPHTIYRQWQEYCKKNTSLNIFYAKSEKDIEPLMIDIEVNWPNNIEDEKNRELIQKKKDLIEKLKSCDAVLVSNTLFSSLQYYCEKNNIVWKRVFIDEADTIHIKGNSPHIHDTSFTWLITATWPNFLMQGYYIRPIMLTYYHQNSSQFTPVLGDWLASELGTIHQDNVSRVTWLQTRSKRWFDGYFTNHVLRGLIVLMCSTEFLNKSRQMPPTNYITLQCEQPATYRVLAGIVSANIQNMLHAGNVEGALSELGVTADTTMNLIEAVTKDRERELDRLRKTYEFKQSIAYATLNAKETALAALSAKISSIETQLISFKERISSTVLEDCPICYDNPKENSATMTPCCHRIFCGACILQSLTRDIKCPMCRTQIKTNELVQLVEETKRKSKKEPTKLLTKSKQLLKFLNENPNARVLVFSRYENPFIALERECDGQGISYHTLRGNKDVIASTIRSFEKGEKRVLFLPTESAGAGLNLVCATHVVLLHAMTPEEEKQAIGRAYRLGRTEQLTVVKLLHEGETLLSN